MMELKELVGEHVLDWVHVAARNPIDKDAEALIFSLDGVAYLAMEDPDDGYRSSMRSLVVLGGVYRIDDSYFEYLREKVVASHRNSGSYSGEADILELRSAVTGALVLAVGTENTDDYYPSFAAAFHPQGLAANARPD